MKKRVFSLFAVLMVVSLMLPAYASAKEVMLYSSMKDSQLAALKDAFMAKHPDIRMDYYTAGTGSVMTKLATEQQAGGIRADIIWVGDPTNYISFKEQGLLYAYNSPEAATIPANFKDPDNYYVAGRVIMLGFVFNKNTLSANEVPKTWEELATFKGYTAMTDPTFSGTTLYTVAGLVQHPDYGWNYLQSLKDNGMLLERGSSAVVTKVGSGEYDVSVGVDYIARTLIAQGSPIDFAYPEKGIPIILSPIAIIKNSANLEEAKLLFDFILSLEGQKILMEEFTAPVRPELSLEGALSVDEAAKRILPVDDDLLVAGKDEMLKKFDSIFK
jgi:iron(III) transport system substrate-binding protein